MPDAAEIVALVLELHDRRDQRRLGETLELRVFDRLAERRAKASCCCGVAF